MTVEKARIWSEVHPPGFAWPRIQTRRVWRYRVPQRNGYTHGIARSWPEALAATCRRIEGAGQVSAAVTVRRRGLRERIEKTRYRYWGKGGQVNVPELTDQILGYLHEQGIPVADNDWEPRPWSPEGDVEEQELRRLRGIERRARDLISGTSTAATYALVKDILGESS